MAARLSGAYASTLQGPASANFRAALHASDHCPLSVTLLRRQLQDLSLKYREMPSKMRGSLPMPGFVAPAQQSNHIFFAAERRR